LSGIAAPLAGKARPGATDFDAPIKVRAHILRARPSCWHRAC
jgi:hypothetical protein